MPTFHFMGYVEPRTLQLMIENLAPIQELDVSTGIVTQFTVTILDCVISVECESASFDADISSQLYTRAVELSRAVVNLIAIKMGWGLFVYLDTFIHPDGKEEILHNQAHHLTGIIDAYGLDDIDDVFQQIGSDVNLTMAFNDMNDALSRPRTTAVNCARTIDTVKHLLAPRSEGKSAWKVVQETLRADEDYLAHISSMSKSSRHGKHDYMAAEEAEEIQRRTWIIFNRYLYHRLHNNEVLAEDRFPRLKSPTARS